MDDLNIPSGTYYISVICDDTFQITELSETDNAGKYNPPITYEQSGVPNLFLYVGEGSVNQYTFDSVENALNVKLSIVNGGEGATGSFRVGIYLSPDNTFAESDYLIGNSTVESLNAGYYKNIEINTDLDDFSIQPGTYYIIIFTDDTFQITESNETDNLSYFLDAITYLPASYPNLTIYEGEGSNNDYSFNAETNILDVYTSVANLGSAEANNFRVGFYLINESTEKITLMESADVDYLNFGYYTNLNIENNLGELGMEPGNYYIAIIYDDLGQVEESNENDNLILFNDAITITTIGAPNLMIYKGTNSINDYNYNYNTWDVKVYASIGNNGEATATNFRVGFYLSDNSNIQTSDILLNSQTISSLEPGYFQNINVTANIEDMSLSEGSYYVGFYADDLKQVSESDETDNTDIFMEPIPYYQPEKGINITTHLGIGANNSYNHTASTNELEVYASIINNGTEDANNFRVGFYLSTDNSIGTSDKLLKGVDIANLAPSTFTIVDIKVNLNDYAPLNGDFYVGFVADDLSDITETAETDNSYYFSTPINLFIVSTPDNPNSANYLVYPNPIIEALFIKQNENLKTSSIITIMDNNGKIVEVHNWNTTTKKNIKELDFSKYTSGLYFLQIANADHVFTQKIVKQ